MAFCGGLETETADFEEDVSLREFSGVLGDSIGLLESVEPPEEVAIGLLESVEPPEEVAEWHDAVLVYQRAIKESLDDYSGSGEGQSEDEYILTTLFPVGLRYQPQIDQAIGGMDTEVRSQMIAAGCIDEETAGSVQMEVERGEVPVGGRVEGSLDEPNETDSFLFEAESGEDYLIEVAWEDLPQIVVRIKDPLPAQSVRLMDSESSPLRVTWTAPESGPHQIDVYSGDATGSYTVSVSIDPGNASPDAPANVHYAWDGSTITVSWDPVEGAEYYNVYHDDFFETGCALRDGNPSFCDELATDVVGSSYTHTSPDTDENYYWVVACNSDGCSETDSEDPAAPVDDGAGSPTSGGPCIAGVRLDPGESCSVVTPGVQAGMFQVRNGSGCYGDICSNESIILSEFIAYANVDGSWLVTRVPDVTSSDPAPVSTPGAAPTPAVAQPQVTSQPSLDEYLAFCGGPGYELGGWEEDVSLMEIAAGWGVVIDFLEPVEPPEVVADWHAAVLTYLGAAKESVDDYLASGGGQSEDDYLLRTLFPLVRQYQPQFDQAISGMAPDVHARLVAAGCIE